MPALPAVSKVIRVDLIGFRGIDNNVIDRIFFAFTGAGPTVADLNTLATTVGTAWLNNLAALADTATGITTVKITDLTSATGAQVVSTQAKTGTRVGTGMAAGVCIVIKFKIARRYRGGHPRFYFGGATAQDLANENTFTTAYQSAVASGFLAFISACETTPPANLGILTHVNVSYFTGFTNKTFPSGRTRPVPTLRGTPLQDPISTYSVNPRVGSQRRRNLQSA